MHGEYNVSVWLIDGQGNKSETPIQDSVFVDARRPIDGSVTTTAISGGVRLDLSGFSDGDSGLVGHKFTGRIGGRKPPGCGKGHDIAQSSGTSIDVTGLTPGETYKLWVCGVDAVGNVSRGVMLTQAIN